MTNRSTTDTSDAQRLKAALDLYDNAPCGSVSFNNDGVIFDVNQTLCTWLGYQKEELIHTRTLLSLFKIGGQIFFETHFFPLIKMQGFIKEVYFDIVRKDKSIFHGLINVREIPGRSDQPTTYQATILDISDRWHYEAELLQAKKRAETESKAKAEFLATISHEIRTPLNSILGIGNLLHKTSLNDTQKEYARLLLHSSEHLLGLVNNLLDLSKIEANKITLERMPFNLYELSSLINHTFAVKATEKGIDLHTTVEDDVPHHLIGDPLKLKQILTNLIGNAIKFTKIGSVSLTISKEAQTDESVFLCFTVADTGIGIPEEKLEAIFQEFSQASYDVSVEFGGTGLGLTISKKLLELHDSTLQVASKLNKGSTFKFIIGYEQTEEIASDETLDIDESDRKRFENMQVLVVDDNPANIFIAEQYLAQWNIQHKSAASGAEALSILKDYKFDLVLLDLQMPIMDGYETAVNIRKLNLKARPAIVAFSASTKGEVDALLEDAGIDDHLSKPFQPKEMFQILTKYYIRPQETAQKTFSQEKDRNPTKINRAGTKEVPQASFNLSRYKKMAQNKPEYLQKFVMSTLDAMVGYQKDFNKAVKKRKLGELSDLIHKSTMSIYYIQADGLSELMKECRSLLEEPTVNEALLSKKASACNAVFNEIITGLKNK